MSSGFVSGGTADEPIERDDEWLKAQQELEATRRRKEDESRQIGGKSLYEILQQNKAAKQDAFEESIRLKNQFRNLDEDEVEFLDSVLESTRAKEESVKKETAEQLTLFRRHQEDADRAIAHEAEERNAESTLLESGSPINDDSPWTVHRKRKRVKETEVAKGLKLRKSSSTIQQSSTTSNETRNMKAVLDDSTQSTKLRTDCTNPIVPKAEAPDLFSGPEKSSAFDPGPKILGLGLDEYGSD